jgi:hypothetical protein
MEKVVTKTILHAKSLDRQYWLSKTAEERIAAVEALRLAAHPNLLNADQRLQRVYRVTQLKRG